MEIWEMTELRNLEFRWGLHLPDPPPSQQANTEEGDATMKNLRTLNGIRDFRLSDEIVKRIPNIKKLKISYELTWNKLDEWGFKYLGLLEKLESLTLKFRKRRGTDLLSFLTFPKSLKKLTLISCGFQWEGMSNISSLPHLEMLKLYENAFIGPEWVLDEEVFRSLKYLEMIRCYDLVHWIADDTHFPRLEHLVLHMMNVEIPSGIGDIPTLQKIKMVQCRASAVISAKKILEEQVWFKHCFQVLQFVY